MYNTVLPCTFTWVRVLWNTSTNKSSSPSVSVPLCTCTGSTWYAYPCTLAHAWLHVTGIGMSHLRRTYLEGYLLIGGKQYGRVGWRVHESPTITYGLSTYR
eukprot:SAG11_NODE_17098_length_528_cov_1.860140_1_plen_100_part_01